MPALGAALLATPTTNQTGHPLNSLYEDERGNTWMYVQAAAAVAAGEWVAVNPAGSAALLTKALADAGRKIGVAQVAFASGDFGWVLIKGVGIARGLANYVADAAAYTSATAGAVDDDPTAQTKILGARITAAIGGAAANAAVFLVTEPHVG
jgi:hypothetical protein